MDFLYDELKADYLMDTRWETVRDEDELLEEELRWEYLQDQLADAETWVHA